MDILSTLGSAAAGPLTKLLLQSVGAQITATYGKALSNAAGDLLTGGIDAAQALVDGLEAQHPAVVAAIATVRDACAGFIHVPTEDEIFAGLNYTTKALMAALQPAA